MSWYEKVRELYPDADRRSNTSRRRRSHQGGHHSASPAKRSRSTIDYRNIREAALQVYKVDLHEALPAREEPRQHHRGRPRRHRSRRRGRSVPLGDGTDFADKTQGREAAIKEEGAFLVICRGDNLFTSGLVLITPLKLEIQETPPAASASTSATPPPAEGYVPEVLVKVVGIQQRRVHERPHRPARRFSRPTASTAPPPSWPAPEASKFAFYRGTTPLGSPGPGAGRGPAAGQPARRPRARSSSNNPTTSTTSTTSTCSARELVQWDKLRRGNNKGVEVQQAK